MKKILQINFIIVLLAFLFFIFEHKFFRNENEERGPDKRPNEWAWLQRTFPFNEADPRAILDAIDEANILRDSFNRLPKSNSEQWNFAGPLNIGGRIVDIEFNPLNPDIVYAGAATGGVLKSTNHGQTWFPIFDEQSNLSIGDIGIDPVNPNIIYVGTGEANGGHNNFPGGGMFKSTDAGETWTHIGLDTTASIGRVIVNHKNPDIVYAAAVGSYFKPNPERGVYKTTDAGNSWKQVFFINDSTGAIDLVMHPTNPETLFVAMWERVRGAYTANLFGPSSGIFRTFDGFNTTTPLNNSMGLPNPATENVGRIGLTIHKYNPNILYALYNDGTNYTGFYRTNDLGNSWQKVDPNNSIENGTASPNGFSWYFGQTRVHPENPDIVFALDVNLMRSTNGGLTWNTNYSGYNVHVDHHALAFDPNNPDYIFLGNDGGINVSLDGGASWQSSPLLPVTQFYEIGLDYQNPQRLYGGTQDNGTIRTLNGLLTDWENINGGDGFYVIVDPTNPEIIYTESQRGILVKKTLTGNKIAMNGISNSEPKNWSTPVIMDPNNNLKLYYGTDRIYRTTDGAENWDPISHDLTTNHPSSMVGTVTTISVSATDSNYIYAGTDDGNVWKTTDGGNNWVLLSASLPVRWVTRILVDPTDEEIVYVTFSGLKWREPQPHVFRSTNGGIHWTNISGNLPDAPVNAIAIDNRYNNIIYVGSDVGVFYTTNGETWLPLGEGLPIVPVNDMKIHPTANYLAAGTHARGIYKFDLNSITSTEEDNLSTDYRLYQNYPNPFNPSTKIKYQISRSGNVELTVYDMLGRKITELVNEIKQPGIYEAEFNGEKLASGIYMCTLKTDSYNKTIKMILLK